MSEPSPAETSSPRWSHLLHRADEPFFVLNARRRLLYVNPAWERWAGVSLKDVRGRACRAADDDSVFGSLAPTKEALGGQWSHVRRRDATGKSSWIDVHFLPWKHDGQVLAILGRIDAIAVAPTASSPPLPEKIVQLRDRLQRTYRLELWESDVPAVRTAVLQARLAAATTAPVLLQGPPGSGKEWLARTIHRLGPRREEFFACLDARLLPPAMLTDLLLQPTTRLNLGAVLLRHPGHLPREMQARLAELLAADTFGPRLFVGVADVDGAARLSPELLTLINALTITLPPLRQRHSDWPRLIPEVLARAAAVANKPRLSLAPDADQALRLHSWPGNFRELDQTIRDAALRSVGERIELGDLPFEFRSEPPPQEPKLPLDQLLESAERRLLQLALEQARRNKSKAAQLLGIARARLHRRMQQLGLADPSEPEGADDA